MRRLNALLLGSVLALAAATPAAAAQVTVAGLDSQLWDKPDVTITAGDSVLWTFPGTVDIHNVMSSSANWVHASPFGAPAPDSTFTFTAPGIYDYLCQVHPDKMAGTVRVTDATGNPPPPPPPPPPGEQPFPNDSGPPGVLETGGLDETPPRLSSVRVRRRSGGASIRFRVSERARVTVRFKRRGKTVKTKRMSASGSYRTTIRDRKHLRASRYRVELRARDRAGNWSGVRSVTV